MAASSTDGSVRIWRVPDVHQVPLHKRSYKDLLSMLRLQTNLRAVPADGSADGYDLKPDAFTGWASPPPQ